jgi:hypothetical protein
MLWVAWTIPAHPVLARLGGSAPRGIAVSRSRRNQEKRRGGSGERRSVSSCPTPVLNRTCRFHPQVGSPGGPACPEPGETGHPRTAYGWAEHLMNISFLRWWAVLPGFPPTPGLPEIFRGNEADGSEATVPHGLEPALRLSAEPPLLFSFLLVGSVLRLPRAKYGRTG